ncbi:hypothetical protein HY620_03245 [Candidatus Uhrbacteria bacterium]|nr:hypothetical protein [Candidatus Uhrbacteria bacterium]
MEYFKRRHQKFYHNTVPNRLKHIIVDSVCVASIAGLLIAIASMSFSAPKTASPLALDISLSDPLPKGGSQVEFSVQVKNTTLLSLNNLVLNVVLPEHFQLEMVDGVQATLLPEMKLDSLGPLASKKYTFTGAVYGEENSEQELHSTVEYDNGKEERLLKRARKTYTVGPSALELQSTFPSSAVYNQIVDGMLRIKNTSDRAQEHLVLSCALPQKTTYEYGTGITQEALSMDPLNANEEKNITLKVRFHDYSASSGTISCSLSRKEKDKIIAQGTTSTTISLVQPTVTLAIEKAQQNALQSGTEHQFSLLLQRREAVEVQKAGVLIEGATPERYFWNDTNTLTAHTLTFSIRIPSDGKKDAITLTPFAAYKSADGTPIDVEGKRFTFPLTTSISLNAFARYYTPEGDQIGRGPLPPQVGETTKYLIFVQPTDTIHTLFDVTVRSRLGHNVILSGAIPLDGQSLTSSDSSELVWSIARLPASTNVDAGGMVFHVSLTPDISMAGIAPLLVESLSISGTDEVTKKRVEYKSPPITTDLIFDTRASGKSHVEKQIPTTFDTTESL